MKKWLQRTVGTASVACGIALAASGIASASGNQPAELTDPLGSVGSLTSVTDTKSVVPDNAKQVTNNLVDLSSNTAADTVKKADGDFVSGIDESKAEGLPVADGLPVVGGLTQGGLPVVGDVAGADKPAKVVKKSTTTAKTEGLPVADGLPVVGGLTQGGLPLVGGAEAPDTGDEPAKKVVKKTVKADKTTEGLPVADGLPMVGGLTQGGLPVVGGSGNPVTGGQGKDMVDGVPLVGNMVGSAVKPAVVPGADKPAPKPENRTGMGSDLVGSTLLGTGAVGGTRDDVTRPAEDLPLVGQLPVVGGLV